MDNINHNKATKIGEINRQNQLMYYFRIANIKENRSDHKIRDLRERNQAKCNSIIQEEPDTFYPSDHNVIVTYEVIYKNVDDNNNIKFIKNDEKSYDLPLSKMIDLSKFDKNGKYMSELHPSQIEKTDPINIYKVATSASKKDNYYIQIGSCCIIVNHITYQIKSFELKYPFAIMKTSTLEERVLVLEETVKLLLDNQRRLINK